VTEAMSREDLSTSIFGTIADTTYTPTNVRSIKLRKVSTSRLHIMNLKDLIYVEFKAGSVWSRRKIATKLFLS